MSVLTKKFKLSNLIIIYLDIFLFIISLIIVFLFKDNVENLPTIGVFIISLSIYLCFKVRKNEKLLFLFAIIGFINVSIGLSDGILKGIHVASWQIPLRETVYNVFTAKSILLFLGIVNLFITQSWINNKALSLNSNEIVRKENSIIAYVGTFTMYAILLLGYDTSALSGGSYISNSNPLIEYAIVIYAIVWFYSSKNISINILLKIYAALYILYSLSFGDRSAAFLMILLYYLLYVGKRYKLTISKLLLLAIIAISLSNFVAELRADSNLEISNIINNALQRGMYSDTVSYSYYASITLTATNHLDDTFLPFIEYLKSWIVGGSNSEFSNLANYVKDNHLYNVGGGLYTSYFYFGLGYLGVILGALLLGFTLRNVYSHKGNLAIIYQILIPVLSIRWYLYGPTSLYRSIFIVSTILIILCLVFHNLLTKEKRTERYMVNSPKQST